MKLNDECMDGILTNSIIHEPHTPENIKNKENKKFQPSQTINL